MTAEDLRTLFAYDAWANRRVLDACETLTAEQFTRDLGSSFPSVRDTLAHILGAEWVWLERFQGRSPSALPKPEEYPDLASLRARWAEVERDLLAFVGGLSDSDLDRTLEYRNFKGQALADRLRHALQHLANHSTYHRGQVATLLRQLGAAPAGTDLITFYRERATQAAHPGRA